MRGRQLKGTALRGEKVGEFVLHYSRAACCKRNLIACPTALGIDYFGRTGAVYGTEMQWRKY